MSAKSKASSALNRLSRQSSTIPEMFGSFATYPDDRTRAIMVSSELEAALEEEIQRHMVEMSDDERDAIFMRDGSPLGTFSAKVKIGFAFGVFGKRTRADLDLIRGVRNVFAHARKPIDFDTPEVAAACAHLETPDRVPDPSTAPEHEASQARWRFEHTAQTLRFSLIFRGREDTLGGIHHPLD